MPSTLIRQAHLITMDPLLGDFIGDLLVVDDQIVAIAPQLEIDDAEVIDAQGMILVPGFVNAHMHTWQTALRGLVSNWTLPAYFKQVHAGLATKFKPADIHVATLAGALNQINCGTTTLGDWCHNNPTPAHTDAAVEALKGSGIRAVFFHGSPKPDPKPGQLPFWETQHPRNEVERLLKQGLGARGSKLGLGLAILGPHYSTLEVAVHDFSLAKEFGLIASMHQGGGVARTPQGWAVLDQKHLLGSHINIVHGNNLSDAELRRFVELGMSFSVTPENELTQGHGFPITGRLLALGASPSLGIDLESGLSGEMFLAARIALGVQRGLDHALYRAQHEEIAPQHALTCRQALEWITIEGARALGLSESIGSLTIGKQADLVLIDARQLNMFPVHDPVNTVVMQTSLANIDSVMIAGQFHKRHGQLLEVDVQGISSNLQASGRRIAEEMGLQVLERQ